MEKMKLRFQRDVTYGYSWSDQRNYTCSFCHKEYKSAQALGGHMNVHRRERAKLMIELSPSTYDLNTNSNSAFSSLSSNSTNITSNSDPNPNPTFSLCSTPKPLRYISYGTPIVPCFEASIEDGKRNLKNEKEEEEEFRVLKKRKNLLKTGVAGVGLIEEDKEDLDLELRLGCS